MIVTAVAATLLTSLFSHQQLPTARQPDSTTIRIAIDTTQAQGSEPTGPRVVQSGITATQSAASPASEDTTSSRPRAIEYSDAYYTRLRIHQVASYAELPLFAGEWVLGDRLIRDERTGFPPSGLKAAHAGVALGLGALFAINTVTGAWNLWDARSDPSNRALRIVHSVAMLGADAGFALAGATGGNAQNSMHDQQRHRNIAVSSMALATAGTAMMWLFNK